MDGIRRKRGQADRDVFRSLRFRRAVLNPLARRRDDRLPGAHVEAAAFVLHPHHPAQHDGDFLELGSLARLDPAGRRSHPGDADAAVPAVHAADKLLNPLRFRAGGLDDGRRSNEAWHGGRSYNVPRWPVRPAARCHFPEPNRYASAARTSCVCQPRTQTRFWQHGLARRATTRNSAAALRWPRELVIQGEPVNYQFNEWPRPSPAVVTPSAPPAPVVAGKTEAKAATPPSTELRTPFFNYQMLPTAIGYMDFFSFFNGLSTADHFKRAV